MGETNALKAQIDELNKLGKKVLWYYNEDGTEAVGITDGQVWIVANSNGWVARYEAPMGELRNGIDAAGIAR